MPISEKKVIVLALTITMLIIVGILVSLIYYAEKKIEKWCAEIKKEVKSPYAPLWLIEENAHFTKSIVRLLLIVVLLLVILSWFIMVLEIMLW